MKVPVLCRCVCGCVKREAAPRNNGGCAPPLGFTAPTVGCRGPAMPSRRPVSRAPATTTFCRRWMRSCEPPISAGLSGGGSCLPGAGSSPHSSPCPSWGVPSWRGSRAFPGAPLPNWSGPCAPLRAHLTSLPRPFNRCEPRQVAASLLRCLCPGARLRFPLSSGRGAPSRQAVSGGVDSGRRVRPRVGLQCSPDMARPMR